MKKIICIAAAMWFFALTASAAEWDNIPADWQQIYSEQYEAGGVGDIYDSLPSDTRDLLDSMGLDPQTGELPQISAENVFSHIFKLFESGMSRPLKICGGLLGIILTVAVIGILGEKSAGLGAVRLASSLCITVTVLLPMFETVTVVINTLKGVAAFMSSFVPVFCASVISSGYSATGLASSAMLMAACQGLSYLLSFGITSFLGVYLALSAVAPVSPLGSVGSPAATVKKVANWALTSALTVFLGILGIQTGITSATDSVALRTAKFMAGNIPVVGSAMGETVSVVKSSMALVSTSSAGYGAVAVAALLCPVILEMFVWRIGLAVCSAVCGIMGDKKSEELINSVDSVWGFLIGITVYVGLLFIISLAIVAKTVRGV